MGVWSLVGALSCAATWLMLAGGCASSPPESPHDSPPMVLQTDRHVLTLWSHCPEGEVGCDDLTAELLDKAARRIVTLHGATYMVKCADGVTPCHLGFYDLQGPSVTVQAYPDGTLALSANGGEETREDGEWETP